MDEDGMRKDRGWRETVASLKYFRHSVACQDFERGTLGRSPERVRVFAHVQGAIGLMRTAVVTDGLSDRQDVRLGERTVEWRSAMPAGAEADPLRGIVGVGPALEILLFETRQIDQHLLRRRLAGER